MEAVTDPVEVRLLARALRVSLERPGQPAPAQWDEWLRTMFPAHFTMPFAERHAELWEWLWAIQHDSGPDPFVAIWPRGGGKTTNAEAGATALGVRGVRRYAWYVSETQDKADNNVRNIATLLESQATARHYPRHSERMLTKYGHSKGWTSQRLRTAGGFTVDAIGLDTAQRGLKVEEQRPDLIVLDDIDGKHDSLQTSAKKIATITTSVLPAGSTNCAVLAVQNLIIPNGFFTRMVDGRADYLSDRIVSGPHPSIVGLRTKWNERGEQVKRAAVVQGEATWAGQSLEVCQRMIDRFGLIAFRKECQHEVKELAEGRVLHYDATNNRQNWTDAEIIAGLAAKKLVPFAGIDYGYWRFAFLLFVVDRVGRVHLIHEYFNQRDDLSTRAQDITEILERYGITKLSVFGDPANPTDARELDKALERGWQRAGQDVKPQWRTTAAIKDKGSRTTGPERINDMFGRRALLLRSGLGTGMRWNLGMNASGEGEPMTGSRFLWEIENWSYPDPKEGQVQDQDPDDNTADGADAMAAFRYGIMSWLRPPKVEKRKKPKNPNLDEGYAKMANAMREKVRKNGVAA